MLVSTITPPAEVPSTRAGMCLTAQAANGAAMTPPASRANTYPKSMPALPRASRKPIEPATATMNSEASMEPTTLRGSRRPVDSRVVVPTGPQPPPPMASISPATRPSGARKKPETRPLNCGRRPPRTRNRNETYRPRPSRSAATHGLATSPSIEDRTVAPAKAPMPPGIAMIRTVRQSTLPSLWCEKPDTSVVPISDRWTAAEADAGATPAAISSVDDVTPYAMPSAPSTSCAKKPTTARMSRLCMLVRPPVGHGRGAPRGR